MRSNRLYLVLFALLLWGGGILARLAYLQCFQGEVLARDVKKMTTMPITEEPRRGSITSPSAAPTV